MPFTVRRRQILRLPIYCKLLGQIYTVLGDVVIYQLHNIFKWTCNKNTNKASTGESEFLLKPGYSLDLYQDAIPILMKSHDIIIALNLI